MPYGFDCLSMLTVNAEKEKVPWSISRLGWLGSGKNTCSCEICISILSFLYQQHSSPVMGKDNHVWLSGKDWDVVGSTVAAIHFQLQSQRISNWTHPLSKSQINFATLSP